MEPMTTGTGGAGVGAGMGASKIVLWVIGILVVAGIGYAVVNNDNDGSMMDDDDRNSMMDDESFSGGLFDLAKRGGDWTCTWSTTQDGVAMEGTVWVSGKRFKSMSRMMQGGGVMTATAVGDGEYMYSWTDASPTGMKFPIEEAEANASDADTSVQTNAQMSQFTENYDFDCSKWRADSATFALPSNVTFTDFSAMMQGLNDGAGVDIEAMMQQYQ